MPLLSVIVPVYNVEPYLRQCLDSILEQGVDELEIIAVDDASTDGSADILTEYEQREKRLVVLRLQRNGGLGNARNAGLDAAGAPYVMFVDSDDWLCQGALPAMVEVLEAADPDVLVYDFARAYGDGIIRPDGRGHLLRSAPAGAFALHEHPALADLLMVVWNKVYRRAFIDDLGLRFFEGFYEDLPWTNPVLMAARRIVVLDRVCYVYRQARSGSIVRTPTMRHFDAFRQYERVFAFLGAHPELEQYRPVVHARMTRHLFTILRKADERVPRVARRRFFLQTAQLYRRHRPAHPTVHPVQDFVLRTDAYALHRLIDPLRSVRWRLQGSTRRTA